MARSHHRKKHKEHVRQFRHSQETTKTRSKGKATPTFIIAGLVAGFAIGYFAAPGNIIWMGAGLIAGGIIGYLIGRRIDGGV